MGSTWGLVGVQKGSRLGGHVLYQKVVPINSLPMLNNIILVTKLEKRKCFQFEYRYVKTNLCEAIQIRIQNEYKDA